MPRSKAILSSFALIGLIILTVVLATGVQAKGGQLSPRNTTPPGPYFASQFSYAVGIPAIHPRAVSNSPTTPSFTAEDVQAYLLAASQPSLTPVQGAHPTLEKVLFVSNKEATQLMTGENPGLPDNALVCFVLVKGPFYVQVDEAPGTVDSTAPIATEVGVVFDAHTGNLLEWGILDSGASSSLPQAAPTQAYTQPTGQPTGQSLTHSPRSLAVQSMAPSISYNCDPEKCWGTNYWPNEVYGAYTYLNWPYPNSTAFGAGTGQSDEYLRNTLWLLDEHESYNCHVYPGAAPSDCWVEAGLKAYRDSNGTNHTILYWGDLRPGYNYAEHLGPEINTLSTTFGLQITIWKAGTRSGISWCPAAGSEWCVNIYSLPDHKPMTGISGDNHTNTMTVSGYRDGMELFGTSGAVANDMWFTNNEWESDKSPYDWGYQAVVGDRTKYVDDYPVDSYWAPQPTPGNYGGTWVTCISGSGC